MSVLLIVLILLLAWAGILLAVYRWKHEAVSLWGPTLMWKTERGRKFIRRVAQRHQFWNRYADAGIVLCLAAMASMFLLILWNVYLTFQIPPEQAPSPQMLLGLPGINPVIPIGYGIAALVVAIVVHELSHGILAMASKLKVKALGVIFFIVPIGAFVEPDEEELEETTARKRSRVFAAGPTTNMILAFICALLFSSILMASISPVTDGIIVYRGVVQDSPADIANISSWNAITEVNNSIVNDSATFDAAVSRLQPGKTYNLTVFSDGTTKTVSIVGGLVIARVTHDYPADKAGLQAGDILRSVNGTVVTGADEFTDTLNKTHPGQSVNVSYYRYSNETWALKNATVVLADKYAYFAENYPSINKESYRNVGLLGVTPLPLGMETVELGYFHSKLAHPISSTQSFFMYIALPFQGLSPFPDGFTELYTTPFNDDVFWPLANMFYWIFWLNFALGTFNVLPAVPLDGGYIFRDGLAGLMRRFGMRSQERREKIASGMTTAFSVVVLAAILSMIFIPQLRGLF